ncbi:MAG: M1 family metallopeptidase [Bacteroidota bacterium]
MRSSPHFRRCLRLIGLWFLAGFAVACSKDSSPTPNRNRMNDTQEFITSMKIVDPHSFARPYEALATHLDLDITVDFANKRISGRASYDVRKEEGATQIIFDTRGINILGVTTPGDSTSEDSLLFLMGDADPVLGQALSVQLTPEIERIHIDFSTRPGAAALQWLDPVQTAGKQHPFLFTQSQAILARTWLPCQDGPGMRFTYNATVRVPKDLLALMSASNPTEINAEGIYKFEMNQPIPAYLMALSVGDLRFKAIGPRTGVYAEPSVLDKGVYEFADMEKMLVAAEELYGPYSWERYDVIVLPPSFPFGGMENPRLTFATPTILAGDRSLTSLIAHELAHSWSGNLVTNATWNDFWLNEGFTVYFERRIMEKLYGESYVRMLSLLGYQDLQATLSEIGPSADDTKLKLNLKGRDPDDGMTDVAYEKGNFLLANIEKTVGRERFDAFLKQYFSTYAFGTMTTESFVDYVDQELVKGDEELRARLNLQGWVYAPGLPADFVPPESDRFSRVDAQRTAWEGGTAAAELSGTAEWTTHEWLHFIRKLPREMSAPQMADLDAAFGFTQSGNSEIQAAWFEHVIRNGYSSGYAALESFLLRVGRRKFLKPLYSALAETPAGKERGLAIYQKARPNYHSVSVGTIDEILNLKMSN